MREDDVQILNERVTFSLRQVCQTCRVDRAFVHELVAEGIIQPREERDAEWYFDGVSLVRIRKAYRLHYELDVNLPGVALALELLDRLEGKSRG
ncbi:MAG: MerR family transcriptional regulator [Proteobacteria bacterium]|jgi:chaperone modulatory protein CbpM|nr:MerR family transcriptional regulator [Pseudomonadota bacterium]MDA1302580.1 MerR family transcriptional regulator [Pseudomonadota bacterium]